VRFSHRYERDEEFCFHICENLWQSVADKNTGETS
jgi:hypothetical protein